MNNMIYKYSPFLNHLNTQGLLNKEFNFQIINFINRGNQLDVVLKPDNGSVPITVWVKPGSLNQAWLIVAYGDEINLGADYAPKTFVGKRGVARLTSNNTGAVVNFSYLNFFQEEGRYA